MPSKTTVYLTDDLKAGLEREARRLGLPEAEVIRRAITAAVATVRPRAGIIEGEPFAARVDDPLEGFGKFGTSPRAVPSRP
jgi:predicted transcriptional regulator